MRLIEILAQYNLAYTWFTIIKKARSKRPYFWPSQNKGGNET